MANDPQRRDPPTQGAPEPPTPGDQGPSTKTFSLKMQSWLMDSGVDAPVEIETAPAAPSAAAPPPDLASPFASRPYHLFAAPQAAPVTVLEPAPSPPVPLAPPVPVAEASRPSVPADPLRASAVPPIPALAASAVPPIPGLAGLADRAQPGDSPRGAGRLMVAGLFAVLAAAGGAGWFFWGEHLRALLKV